MCKLLMIDDNPVDHMIVEIMLSNYKLFPDTAHSIGGKSILEFFELHYSDADILPDLIFLDLNMPEVSGWDFMNTFAKLYPLLSKRIDVYIASSSVNEADRLRSKEYPFVKAYFSKPMLKETLVDLYSLYRPTTGMAS